MLILCGSANGYSSVNNFSYYCYGFLVEALMFHEHIFLVIARLFHFSHVVPSVNAPTYFFNGGLIQSLLLWKHLYLEYISMNNGSQ